MLPRPGGLGMFLAMSEVAAAGVAADGRTPFGGGAGPGQLAVPGTAGRGAGGQLARGWVMAVTGTRVLGGRYVLGEVLGTGGMATVWRARDEVLGREVAVKVLSPQYAADPGFLARFEREARHAARLSHPRLVTVFDCGVDGDDAVHRDGAGRGPDPAAGPGPGRDAAGRGGGARSPRRSARRWRWRTRPGWCTATSRPRTSCWPAGEVKVLDFGIARAEGGTGGHRDRGGAGHRRVPVPGAGLGPPGRPAGRPVLAGLRAVRDAHRRAAVLRRFGGRAGLPAGPR